MKKMNVFISHHGKDDEHIKELKDKLKEKGYTLKNSSIDSTKPNNAHNEEYIKQQLRPRIEWAGKCIVLIGDKTYSRSYVNWEIEYAARQGKPVIGVYLWGKTDAKIPPALEKVGYSCVAWNVESILSALKSNPSQESWQNPDGTQRESVGIARGVC